MDTQTANIIEHILDVNKKTLENIEKIIEWGNVINAVTTDLQKRIKALEDKK